MGITNSLMICTFHLVSVPMLYLKVRLNLENNLTTNIFWRALNGMGLEFREESKKIN